MGMMSLPQDRNLCMEATAALGIDVKRRQQISASPQNFCVAPWHYDLRHRIRDGGKWKARKLPFGKKYTDGDGKKFVFPPPNYSVR